MSVADRRNHGRNGLVGRLAPSPTGGLHLGHARTFLIAWLAARSGGGRMVLRIEDLDAVRVRLEAISGAIADLKWLGLDWDEGPDVGGESAPYVQSERRPLYQAVLERLMAAEMIYPCTCTRADVERAASAPHPEDEGPTYPGTCAHRSASESASFLDRPFAWRFRVPAASIAWEDIFQGRVEIDPARVGGDFIIARNEVGPAYQLAVVVDDAAMGVNQVIRGADLINSTPRQILLNRALGRTPPAFGHVSLALSPDGRRLAKRDGSLKLATLREAEVDPRILVGSLIQSCGWSREVIPSTPRDWIGRFDATALPASAWILTPDWLESLRQARMVGRSDPVIDGPVRP
jgi:glutamyl-tRNA synthetase